MSSVRGGKLTSHSHEDSGAIARSVSTDGGFPQYFSLRYIMISSINVSPQLPYFCLNGERATLKNKTFIGAASLEKKKTEFPTDMHAQCKLSGEKGKFCFLRAFSKNVLKRQIIIFHLACGDRM